MPSLSTEWWNADVLVVDVDEWLYEKQKKPPLELDCLCSTEFIDSVSSICIVYRMVTSRTTMNAVGNMGKMSFANVSGVNFAAPWGHTSSSHTPTRPPTHTHTQTHR